MKLRAGVKLLRDLRIKFGASIMWQNLP